VTFNPSFSSECVYLEGTTSSALGAPAAAGTRPPDARVGHGRDPHEGSNSKARVRVIRLNLSPSDPIT